MLPRNLSSSFKSLMGSWSTADFFSSFLACIRNVRVRGRDSARVHTMALILTILDASMILPHEFM